MHPEQNRSCNWCMHACRTETDHAIDAIDACMILEPIRPSPNSWTETHRSHAGRRMNPSAPLN
jgi:hypothetical protein